MSEKVLVIVLAETRAHEHTFELFCKNVLKQFSADLCLCVAENTFEDTNNPFYKHATHIWRCPEYEDWGRAFDEAQRQLGCDTPWRPLLSISNQWLGGIKGTNQHPGSAGILLFFRWFLKQCLINTETLFQYDRFVITRSDFMHRIPHVPLRLLDPDSIWIPYGEDYGGYTDRHIVVHQKDVLSVLSITDPILMEPQRLAEEMSHYNEWNLEQFIRFSFERQGLLERIRRFPYSMYSVRGINGRTRWSSGSFDEKSGHFIKYKSEYRRYIRARRWIHNADDWTTTTLKLLNAQENLYLKIRDLKSHLRSFRKLIVSHATQQVSCNKKTG
ncbi:MAG: hypothetical protein ABGW78_12445 [Pirellulales bacterium]